MQHPLMETKTHEQQIYQGYILRLDTWQVQLPDGQPAERDIVVLKGASAVVPITEDGKIILVQQSRVAVDRVTLELPAGKLNSADEDPLEAAKRELSEETGCRADCWQKLTVMEAAPAFCTERVHIYLAQGLTYSSAHPDEGEFVAPVQIPLQEALQRVMDGTLRDAKTCIGILMASQLLNHSNE